MALIKTNNTSSPSHPSSPSLSVRPSVRPSNDPKSRMHVMHGITFAISPHSCHAFFVPTSCLSCLSTLFPPRPRTTTTLPIFPSPRRKGHVLPAVGPHPCTSIIKNPTARPHPQSSFSSQGSSGPAPFSHQIQLQRLRGLRTSSDEICNVSDTSMSWLH